MTPAAATGPSHPDAVTYRRTADAFRARDLDTVATTIHEQVVWHFPGSSWMAREVVGRSALLAYLSELVERTDGTFSLQDVTVSGYDDHVVAVQRFGATVAGEARAFDITSVLRFDSGLQRERWFHVHDQQAFDEFFTRADARAKRGSQHAG